MYEDSRSARRSTRHPQRHPKAGKRSSANGGNKRHPIKKLDIGGKGIVSPPAFATPTISLESTNMKSPQDNAKDDKKPFGAKYLAKESRRLILPRIASFGRRKPSQDKSHNTRNQIVIEGTPSTTSFVSEISESEDGSSYSGSDDSSSLGDFLDETPSKNGFLTGEQTNLLPSLDSFESNSSAGMTTKIYENTLSKHVSDVQQSWQSALERSANSIRLAFTCGASGNDVDHQPDLPIVLQHNIEDHLNDDQSELTGLSALNQNGECFGTPMSPKEPYQRESSLSSEQPISLSPKESMSPRAESLKKILRKPSGGEDDSDDDEFLHRPFSPVRERSVEKDNTGFLQPELVPQFTVPNKKKIIQNESAKVGNETAGKPQRRLSRVRSWRLNRK